MIGVLLDALAAGSTYVTQLLYASIGGSRGKIFKAGLIFRVLTLLLVAGSYVMFALGTCAFYRALVK